MNNFAFTPERGYLAFSWDTHLSKPGTMDFHKSKMKEIIFDKDGITFNSYPYPGASIYPSGMISYAEIRDVDPRTAPPELRLRTGETIFVPATSKEEFEAAIAAHNLPLAKRQDVWSLLLEPFLDTSATKKEKEDIFRELEEVGISRNEAKKIRRKVGLKMFPYNAIHLEWVHLGLADLLEAYLPAKPLRTFGFANFRFKRLYKYAMSIAELGVGNRNG